MSEDTTTEQVGADQDATTAAVETATAEIVVETAENVTEAEESTEAEAPKGHQTKAGPKSHVAKVKEAKAAPAPVKAGVPKLPHSKKYRKVFELVDPNKAYTIEEAIDLAKKTATTKFDSAVELHVHVGVEARGTVKYPHSTGKAIKVAVASPELFEELGKDGIKFDVLISTPAMMPQLAKFARLLGPRGLMPNPKSGTITEDVEKVKAELEAGRKEYRSDSTKNIHLVVGRVSQEAKDIQENAQAALDGMISWGIKNVTISTTMGPGIKVILPQV